MRHVALKGCSLAAAVPLILSAILFGGCKGSTGENIVPYIPPAYLECTEITTYELAFSYWSPYSMRIFEAEGRTIPGEAYRGKVFVIKNYPITSYVLKEVKKGYIWVDMIKCFALNSRDLSRLKAGTFVDVVGINKGPEAKDYLEFSEGVLVFVDCAILPAGIVKLPTEGTSYGVPVY
jgi:hypothetical protein